MSAQSHDGREWEAIADQYEHKGAEYRGQGRDGCAEQCRAIASYCRESAARADSREMSRPGVMA